MQANSEIHSLSVLQSISVICEYVPIPYVAESQKFIFFSLEQTRPDFEQFTLPESKPKKNPVELLGSFLLKKELDYSAVTS